MKTHKITTSKGEFLVKEYSQDRGKSIAQALLDKFCGRMDGYEFICKLSEATEDDAKEVVDNHYWDSGEYYKDYIRICSIHRYCYTALESLHSLLTSKGIDINNGNWYLFKKIK